MAARPPLLLLVGASAVLVASALPGTSRSAAETHPRHLAEVHRAARPIAVVAMGPVAAWPGPNPVRAADAVVPTPPAPIPPVVEVAPPPAGSPAAPPPATPTPAPLVPLFPPADELVPLDPASGYWLQRRAVEVLGMISYPWELLRYDVVFDHARAGIRARTIFSERRIEVYARQSDTAADTAFDLAHELGHAFDWELGSGWGRSTWLRARRVDVRRPWYGCNACDDLATPAGDFAESFAAWQVAGGRFGSRLGPPPDEAQRALLAQLTLLLPS